MVKNMDELYKLFYKGLINKDERILNDILDDAFQLIHMTGSMQSKAEYIQSILDGTMNYYSQECENLDVNLQEDKGILIGDSKVIADIYHTGKRNWYLRLKIAVIKKEGKWVFYKTIASSYR